jgi:hypothetical protein
MGPPLYLIYTADLPTVNNTTIVTFADDTALLAANNDPVVASQHLQRHLNLLQQWYSKVKKIDKISASYSNHEKYNLPASYRQQSASTGSDRSKILGVIYRPQTDVAETRRNRTSEVKFKTTKNVLSLGP